MGFKINISSFKGIVFVLQSFFSSFFFISHCYANLADVDKICRNAPGIFEEIKIDEKGFRNLGTACYGFGGNIKLRNSIAIPKGEKKLLKSKINHRKIKSRYCSSEKALKIFQIVPFFITYYSFEGAFLEEVIIDGATCTNYLKKMKQLDE